jgi:stress response protein SCP2
LTSTSDLVKYFGHRNRYGECVLRYDNETGKGDHRHVGDVETSYSFSGYEKLLADFWADVDAWRQRR